jgi:hypothetical protein
MLTHKTLHHSSVSIELLLARNRHLNHKKTRSYESRKRFSQQLHSILNVFS